MEGYHETVYIWWGSIEISSWCVIVPPSVCWPVDLVSNCIFRQVFETSTMLVSFDHAVLMVGCNGGALDVQMDFGGRKDK